MTLEELPGWAQDMLAGARVAHLGLTDERGHPRVLPVTYALADGFAWSAIDHKPKRSAEPARVRYLRRRPEAALSVDLYDDDWSRLAWVQVLGRVEVLRVDAGPAGVEALRAKYQQYSGVALTGPLLRLGIERAISWRASD